ncbi:MAG: hypothetical protein L0Y66_22015, partial [Myxococcaceae bacterium]|nr:hypothetical protein [Myxococcaceae bacterium]
AVARADDRPHVLVLMGQFHVAPCHLPMAVGRALGRDSGISQQVVYQNCEGIWWALARDGHAGRAEAVELPDGSLCLVNASPVVCQQSFLDHLELAVGEGAAPELTAPGRVKDLARHIAHGMGVRLDGALDALEVVSLADPDLERRLLNRGRFTPREAAALRRHVLSRESAYIPRARMVYLASHSLHHAAEEAAHFVRHCAVGTAMDAPRTHAEAFYARCWEEALAYFGAKLVNPLRRCVDVREWARVFREQQGEQRDVAAFVLAHKASELQSDADLDGLVPTRRSRLLDAVSHALGYLLGDALFAAYDRGDVSRTEVRALFQNPLEAPRELYLTWARRLAARKSRPPLPLDVGQVEGAVRRRH